MMTGSALSDMWTSYVKVSSWGNDNGWFRCPTTLIWSGLHLPEYLISDHDRQAVIIDAVGILREQGGGPIPNTKFMAAGNLPSSITVHVTTQIDMSDSFVKFVSNPGVCVVPFKLHIGALSKDSPLASFYKQYGDAFEVVCEK